MTRINPKDSRIINTKGIQNNMKNAQEGLQDLINKTVDNLTARAEREVPEYGPFKLVYEEFKNPDKDMIATDFMLMVKKPEGLKNEKTRFLEAVAYNLPSPYKAERLIASGDKEVIMKTLKDEKLKADLPKIFKQLSKHLEDV